ncbi:MAG: ribokinase [Nitratireductor sp.]
MAILNVGSINIDGFYRIPAIPQPGETISALDYTETLGGKGLNQSFAVALAGGKIRHAGAINRADTFIIEAMSSVGIDCTHVARLDDHPTGRAVVMVASDGENAIVLNSGANHQLPDAEISSAIAGMSVGDWLLVQNETNATASAISKARSAGLKIALAAAPFVASDILPLLPSTDLLMVNEVEYAQLCAAEPSLVSDGSKTVLITRGSQGAELRSNAKTITVPAHAVDVVDTTGAGDTFTGYLIAALDAGEDPERALRLASAAAAVSVTRNGAAASIPSMAEVTGFLARV